VPFVSLVIAVLVLVVIAGDPSRALLLSFVVTPCFRRWLDARRLRRLRRRERT